MKRTLVIALSVLVLVIGVSAIVAYAAYSYGRRSMPPPATPTIQIEKLAQLATVKVYVADVLEAKHRDVSGAWLIKGDALITVDMKRATTVSKDDQKKQIVLRLPTPTVVQSRVDHTKTKTYDVKKGLFVFGTAAESEMRDLAMTRAQEMVEQAVNKPEHIQIAREVAEKIVQGIYKMVDWDATIQWEDEKSGAAPKEPPKPSTP